MGKIVIATNVSLDGVVRDPPGSASARKTRRRSPGAGIRESA